MVDFIKVPFYKNLWARGVSSDTHIPPFDAFATSQRRYPNSINNAVSSISLMLYVTSSHRGCIISYVASVVFTLYI